MDAKLQLRIQRYGWDAAATTYQDDWQAQLRPAHDTLLAHAELKSGQSVLETACGTGLVTHRIAQLVGSDGLVSATDLSGEMISRASALCDQNSISNIAFKRMDAEKLDFGNDRFDAAICALGLMYMPSPRAALAEMARTLRPGGKATATIWGERKNCGWAEIFPIVDARVASDVCPMFFASGPPGMLAQDFEFAGFCEVQEIRQTEMLCFEDAASLCRAVMLGGPVAMAVKRFSEPTMAEVRAEFLASVDVHKTRNGSYAIPGEFVTACGIAPEC